ncbi:MAG: S-adenosylmethionine decarboxylase [Pelagibacteraceae bacterium]|nr:S-adenosylmethionine decarboxylase [Pelagibacteraceae bacterium]|tara:strand:+ start:1265 stop:1648 length:384 start_codon:yes stop_codon:yes gene_type:complete
MTVKHKHLIIRANIKKPPTNKDINTLTDWIRQLIKKIDMKILGGPYTTYCEIKGNKGMTSVTIIETSHIALHTWDEINPALLQLDVYSCADFDPKIIFELVNKEFEAIKIEQKFIDREKGLEEVKIY